jgi:histidine phosphotransferase ChpT
VATSSEEPRPTANAGAALRIAELLCSRLCHDLSGITAAVIGALEIANEGLAGSEALLVATDAAIELGGRLKLLRAAWGLAAAELDLESLQAYGASLTTSRRIQLDLTGLEPGAIFPPDAGRMVLNVLLLAADSLPRGGTVAISGSPAGDVVFTITGPRAAWPAGLGAFLADDAAAIEAMADNPRGLQAPLTALLALANGFGLSVPAPGAAQEGIAPPLRLSLTPG